MYDKAKNKENINKIITIPSFSPGPEGPGLKLVCKGFLYNVFQLLINNKRR